MNDKTLENGDMIHLSQSGDEVTIEYQEQTPPNPPLSGGQYGAKMLVMAGKPLDEPVVAYGPFVMNTHAEIIQAFADVNSGKMGVVD